MKIAFVYDRVNKIGGAERILEALHQVWPDAPLYTAVYDQKRASWAKKIRVTPSFLNKVPFASSHHEFYPWLMPLAFESFDFDEFDVVLSITSEAAKGVVTKPGTTHLCYCLTPTRYLWSGYDDYFKSSFFKLLTKPVVSYLRSWDKIAAYRPDHYFAISENVKTRIQRFYHQEAEVICPPVDTDKFKPLASDKQKNYFLVVSRLVGYKRIDLVIDAFNRLGLPLKIIGTGYQERKLKRLSKKNIEFLGQLTDKELLGYYQNCRALIFPQDEDFGLVPIEAQSCGRPVIAYFAGGAKETIIDGKTGIFFNEQRQESILEALNRFNKMNFKPLDCRRQAQKFDSEIFKKKMKNAVLAALGSNG